MKEDVKENLINWIKKQINKEQTRNCFIFSMKFEKMISQEINVCHSLKFRLRDVTQYDSNVEGSASVISTSENTVDQGLRLRCSRFLSLLYWIAHVYILFTLCCFATTRAHRLLIDNNNWLRLLIFHRVFLRRLIIIFT